MDPLRRWLTRWGLALGLVIAYVYSFPYFPLIQSANELPRVYLVQAIVDEGRFEIDTGVARWGGTADVSPHGGHHYSNKAPGSSLLAVPAYWALKAVKSAVGGEPTLAETLWVCRMWTSAIPSLLFLLLLWRFLARWAPDVETRRLIVVAYALGTMAMTYSVLFIAHQLSAVLIGTAWILTVWVLDDRRAVRWMLVAGLAAGAAPLVDYQSVFAAGPIAVWGVWRLVQDPRRWAVLGLTAVGAAIPIAMLLWYHDHCFGSPWATGYAASETFAHFHQRGLLGMDQLRLEAFVGSTISMDNGLFVFSPVLLAAALGWWRMLRDPAERATGLVTLAIAVLYLLFISSLSFWRGGWQVGPRYITAMLPFWLPALAVAARWASVRPWSRGVFAAAVLVSVFVYTSSSALYPHFPDRFPNPIFEVTLRLLGDGVAPWNAGWLLGLRGLASLIPYFAIVVALVGWAVVPDRRALTSAAMALVIAVAVVIGYGAFRRGDAADDQAYQRFVAGAMPR